MHLKTSQTLLLPGASDNPQAFFSPSKAEMKRAYYLFLHWVSAILRPNDGHLRSATSRCLSWLGWKGPPKPLCTLDPTSSVPSSANDCWASHTSKSGSSEYIAAVYVVTVLDLSGFVMTMCKPYCWTQVNSTKGMHIQCSRLGSFHILQ